MNELTQHPRLILEVMAAYWVFSAIVTSMPAPPAGSFWYAWIYGALHALAGNIKQFADSKLQALESTTVTSTVVKKKENTENP